MSLAQIQSTVEEFLISEQNDMLLIKGGWGVGKTFFWRRVLEQSRRDNKVSKKSYAYVSLFGVNDIQDLKNAIYASRLIVDQWKAPLFKNTDIVHQVKRLVRPIEQLPVFYNHTGGIVTTALFLFVRDVLICVDDLERKGDGLPMRDVLGLLSMLKDQRNCKIVLILNDDTLEQKEADEFQKHSEKLIDLDLRFSPSISEAFDYISPANDWYRDYVRECCLKLEIQNIRILQRIRVAINKLSSLMKDAEPDVVKRAIQAMVLYIWCKYEKGFSTPTFEFLENFSIYPALIRSRHGELDETTIAWIGVLNRYGYARTGAFERLLMSFANSGYVNAEPFKEEVARLNTEARAEEHKTSFRRAWQLFHNSFDNNEEEFVEELVGSFTQNITVYSPDELESVVQTLDELRRGDLSDKIIDYYMNKNRIALGQTAIHNLHLFSRVKDKRILERAVQAQKEGRKQKGLSAIIKSYAVNRSLDDVDIEYLASCPVGDYYAFFKSEKSDMLYYYIKASLEVRNYQSVNANAATASQNARMALFQIASESRYNWLRLRNMRDLNLDLPEEHEVLLRELLNQASDE